MTKVIFIGATGTDIGKTHVTCLLLEQLREQGHRARAIKPVISGFDAAAVEQSDSGQILQAMGEAPTLARAEQISPWRYPEPLPPHLAAERSGRPINFDQLVQFCQDQARADLDYLLIEGVGGIMTPINREKTTLDLVERLGSPCLIVTGSYLGTLSHTLTCLTAIQQRNVEILGLIVSESLENYINFDIVIADFTKMLPHIAVHKLARNEQNQNMVTFVN